MLKWQISNLVLPTTVVWTMYIKKPEHMCSFRTKCLEHLKAENPHTLILLLGWRSHTISVAGTQRWQRHCSWSRRNHTWWQHRQMHNANAMRKRGLAGWVFHQGKDHSQRKDKCFTVGHWRWGSVYWSNRKTKWEEEAEGSEMIVKPLLAGSFPSSPMRGTC